MKRVLKISVFIAGLIGLVVVSYLWYLHLTYIDETVNAGSAHGYTIGQSKKEAFGVAAAQYTSREVAGIHIDEPFGTIEPVDPNYRRLEPSDSWTLFPGKRRDFFDVVKLRFVDGKLVEIHRNRQRFELP